MVVTFGSYLRQITKGMYAVICHNKFADDILKVRKSDTKFGHYMYYEVFRTEYLDYDLEEDRCENRYIMEEPTVRDCIESYINANIGCNIPWHNNTKESGKQDCSSKKQFQKYQSLAFQMATMNAREMEQETGCIRDIHKLTYGTYPGLIRVGGHFLISVQATTFTT